MSAPAARPAALTIALTAPGGPITFTYDHGTHVISDDTPVVLGAERAAHWLRGDLIAWDLPAERDGLSYRLHAAPEGGLAVEDGAIAGASFPIAPAGGLPAAVRYALHPVQAGGGDPVVRGARYDAATGTFTIPARTVAVFSAPR